MKVLVVGAGLFGSMISKALHDDGHHVVCIDSGESWAASKCAACLMKPTWLTKVPREQLDAAFQFLDENYGLHTLQFNLPPTRGQVPVQWVDPELVLNGFKGVERGVSVQQIDLDRSVRTSGRISEHFEFDQIIVCTGISVAALTGHRAPVKPQWGIAYSGPEGLGRTNTISVWAPYRQQVRFTMPGAKPRWWGGDGAAWKIVTPQHEEKSLERADGFLGRERQDLLRHRRMGIRPYAAPSPGHPCVIEETHPGIWTVTGGAKNGTIAAAWAAHWLRRRLG